MSSRVAIVGGGGGVGAAVAYSLLLRPEPYDVTLVDAARHMAISHEMDLQQVIAQGAPGSVTVGELDDVADADIVVVTASVPLTLNTSRNVYLDGNAAIVAGVAEALAGWDGTLLLVTNPVDALATWLVRRNGLPRERVLGYTLNDSLRLRTALGDLLGVDRHRVDAWMLGEHGDGAVPLWDRVVVDGLLTPLSEQQRAAAMAFVRDWYVTHVALDSGRSSTWTSGHGVARMVAALIHGDADGPWPASIVLDGEYGLDGVALSVPVTLGGRDGVTAINEWPLSDDERAALHAAAHDIAVAASSLP